MVVCLRGPGSQRPVRFELGSESELEPEVRWLYSRVVVSDTREPRIARKNGLTLALGYFE